MKLSKYRINKHNKRTERNLIGSILMTFIVLGIATITKVDIIAYFGVITFVPALFIMTVNVWRILK